MKFLLIAFSIFSITAFAQEKESKSQVILDKLSTKIKGMKSFYIEFSASIKNAAGANESEIGKGWVKGDKFYASYGDNTIISNGLKTWTIVKEEKTVYETDASGGDEESINPKKLMTIWEKDFKNAFEKEETLNGETVYVIKLVPKEPKKVDYHTILLYISKTSNELKKAVMKSKNGTTMTYSLTKFTANPTVEDTKFVYDSKKYPGYSLVKD
ncbi:MAG: outer membrane lipoprotein carrier protein LolA [Crocinitomicaceae bacterium]|jgi:outer membrane lipoprotein-sorting protein|nr:MAG: outer membrane lipoprotein carrier protein LolA [Crocinitomicaceae bacterium]